MAQDDYQSMDEPTKFQKCKVGCCKCLKLTVLVVVVGLIAYQGGKYWWATTGCNPGNLQGYDYANGIEDLLPVDTLLIEQKKVWNDQFAVYPATKDGLQKGGSEGIFFRIWGPLFYTYGYQDVLGNKILTIRPALFAIGDAHVLTRCDGRGDTWTSSEGMHWFPNQMRALFGMFVSAEYNIYNGSTPVALSQQVGHGSQQQLIFHKYTSGEEIGSALLSNRHYHGRYDQWFVEDQQKSPLPAYVTSSIAVLLAYKSLDEKRALKAADKEETTTLMPTFLMEDVVNSVPNSTEKVLAKVERSNSTQRNFATRVNSMETALSYDTESLRERANQVETSRGEEIIHT